MPSLWFVMPAHGRLELARICMRQLRRTCDELDRNGVRASAVVVADDENLDTARDLGFATQRVNAWVGTPNAVSQRQLRCPPPRPPRTPSLSTWA